jgi:hypothetical protein
LYLPTTEGSAFAVLVDVGGFFSVAGLNASVGFFGRSDGFEGKLKKQYEIEVSACDGGVVGAALAASAR